MPKLTMENAPFQNFGPYCLKKSFFAKNEI